MTTTNLPSGDGSERVPEGNGSILINFVLDKSGSMDVIRSATISGFNEFKNDQARDSGNALLTLTLFDTNFRTVCEAVPVREVSDLDGQTYAPGGMTALYDAIGHTMRITDDYVAAHKPDQVLFVIMTDGQENSSREFSRERILQMIEDRRRLAEYEFIYLGANQDSYAVGRSMGVAPGHSLDYQASPAMTAETMKRVSHNVRGYWRKGEKHSDEFFTQAYEEDGALEPEEWERKKQAEAKKQAEGK